MKKLLTLVLTTTLAFTLFGCSSSSSNASSNSSQQQEVSNNTTDNVKVSDINAAVFYYDFSDVYISSVRSGMDQKLKSMGISYQNYDGSAGQATQTEQITTAITNGANLLIVNIYETSSPDAAQNATNAAKAAGIPIIFFNREVSEDVILSYEKCAFVGTNAPEAGHMQGEMIGEYLLENFDSVDLNGDGVISYVMFKGQEGNAEAEARTQFAVEDADILLESAGKEPLEFYNSKNSDKYLVDQEGTWSAKAATDYMSNILAEYSEANNNMVEVVIANNDGMAEGAISALQSAGFNNGAEKTIPVFGVDATDSAKQLIDQGKMTGTIMQDSEGMVNAIMVLVENVSDGDDLMDGTSNLNVDDGVSKIRVPYGIYTAK